ncbi:MAG: metallophosphoesterase [Proteobacteria bacterium]|nr:metallophosphoesterase [Pseudomonadota bacterium]
MRTLLLPLVLVACSNPEPVDSVEGRGAWTTPPPSVIQTSGRLVGFADVHGDYDAAVEVLQLAGLVDASLNWSGGTTVAVQTGDQLDRGDGERAILDLFESLSEQAWDAGGGFYPLLGNHETMNVELDFRYVTDGGWADFADVPFDDTDAQIMAYPEAERGRAAAFRPGGPYAQMLSGHNLAMQVNDTVFVHGGILPEHARTGLETINAEVQQWMRGERASAETWVGSGSPVWTRLYSEDPTADACASLGESLELLGATRMVVGHTVQDMANPACGGRVWLMDVGMADHYGGSPAALVMEGQTVTVLE